MRHSLTLPRLTPCGFVIMYHIHRDRLPADEEYSPVLVEVTIARRKFLPLISSIPSSD
jgi:hypothetical protein